MQNISGRDIDVMIGDMMVHIEEASISIEDNRTTSFVKGRPNGWVSGDIKASGEVTLDTTNFNILIESARSAGAFQKLALPDLIFSADVGDQSLKIEAYGCLLKISDLLNASANGGEKTTHKLPFEVTDPNFVKINGVPYADSDEAASLF